MASLSTHVLDTALGRPAEGIAVTLERQTDADTGPIVSAWQLVGSGTTDADGRIAKGLLGAIAAGVYRITFDTGTYLARVHGKGFYPYAPIVFEVTADQHYHVPLLLSPFGIATYRGS